MYFTAKNQIKISFPQLILKTKAIKLLKRMFCLGGGVVRGVFRKGVLARGFCPGVFCPGVYVRGVFVLEPFLTSCEIQQLNKIQSAQSGSSTTVIVNGIYSE